MTLRLCKDCKAHGDTTHTAVRERRDGKYVPVCPEHAGDTGDREAARREAIGRARTAKGHETVARNLPGGVDSAEWIATARRAASDTVTLTMLREWRSKAERRYGDPASVDLATDRATDGYTTAVVREASRTGDVDAVRAVRSLSPETIAHLVNAAGRSGDGRDDTARSREVAIVGEHGDAVPDTARSTDPASVVEDRETIRALALTVARAVTGDLGTRAYALAQSARTVSPETLASAWDGLTLAIANDLTAKLALARADSVI